MTITLLNYNNFPPATMYRRQIDWSCSKHLAVTCIPELHPRTLGGWLVATHFTVYMYIYTKLRITLRVCSRDWFQNSILLASFPGSGEEETEPGTQCLLSSLGNLHTTPLHKNYGQFCLPAERPHCMVIHVLILRLIRAVLKTISLQR